MSKLERPEGIDADMLQRLEIYNDTRDWLIASQQRHSENLRKWDMCWERHDTGRTTFNAVVENIREGAQQLVRDGYKVDCDAYFHACGESDVARARVYLDYFRPETVRSKAAEKERNLIVDGMLSAQFQAFCTGPVFARGKDAFSFTLTHRLRPYVEKYRDGLQNKLLALLEKYHAALQKKYVEYNHVEISGPSFYAKFILEFLDYLESIPGYAEICEIYKNLTREFCGAPEKLNGKSFVLINFYNRVIGQIIADVLSVCDMRHLVKPFSEAVKVFFNLPRINVDKSPQQASIVYLLTSSEYKDRAETLQIKLHQDLLGDVDGVSWEEHVQQRNENFLRDIDYVDLPNANSEVTQVPLVVALP